MSFAQVFYLFDHALDVIRRQFVAEVHVSINFKTVISPYAASAPRTASIYGLSRRVEVTRIRADYVEKIDTKQQQALAHSRAGGYKRRKIAELFCFFASLEARPLEETDARAENKPAHARVILVLTSPTDRYILLRA